MHLLLQLLCGFAVLLPQNPTADESAAPKHKQVAERKINNDQPKQALPIQPNPQDGKREQAKYTSKDESKDWLYRTYLVSGPIVGIIAFGTGILVYIQIQAMKQIERAWIVVSTEPPRTMQKVTNQWLSHGFGFNWYIKNCGKTPAFVTKIAGRIHPIKSLTDLPKEPVILKLAAYHPQASVAEFPHGMSIGPTEVIPWYTFADPADKQPITVEQWNDMRAGKFIWVAYGVVEYRLAFSSWRKRQTRFCYVWTPEASERFTRSSEPASYTKQT